MHDVLLIGRFENANFLTVVFVMDVAQEERNTMTGGEFFTWDLVEVPKKDEEFVDLVTIKSAYGIFSPISCFLHNSVTIVTFQN